MWNISLTKADKRKCRELIHVGLERECEKYVKEMQKLVNTPIPLAELNEPYREENGFSVEGPWHKRYIALYKKTASFDKHIAQRYDGMTGGHYNRLSRSSASRELSKFVSDPASGIQAKGAGSHKVWVCK